MLTDIQTLALRSCLRLGTPAGLESRCWEASPVPGSERQCGSTVINLNWRSDRPRFEPALPAWWLMGKFQHPSEPPSLSCKVEIHSFTHSILRFHRKSPYFVLKKVLVFMEFRIWWENTPVSTSVNQKDGFR